MYNNFLDNCHHKSHQNHHKLSAGAVAGITLGVVLLLCTSLIVTCVCVRHYCRKRCSPVYILLHNQYPRILVANGDSDNESDFKACIPAQPTAVPLKISFTEWILCVNNYIITITKLHISNPLVYS